MPYAFAFTMTGLYSGIDRSGWCIVHAVPAVRDDMRQHNQLTLSEVGPRQAHCIACSEPDGRQDLCALIDYHNQYHHSF